ncbi:MAG: Holliday junction resolvase RuvX [Acutalibacteraceae bacterium]
MIIMSVDLGLARTGLAICDKGEMLASPLCVIEEKSPQRLLEKIMLKIEEKKPELIAVGLPKNMDGSEGESAKRAREFAKEIEAQSGIRTVMRDERLTTVTAHNYLNITDTRGKKRKAVVDSVAATVILQDFLDYRRIHNTAEEMPT